MSIKTTYCVSQETAIAEIEKRLNSATSNELGEILEIIIGDTFANFDVVSESEFSDSKSPIYPSFYKFPKLDCE